MPSVGQIDLQTRRTIYMHSLQQSQIYAGLLEGLPTRQMNRRIIDNALAEERKKTWAGEPYLVPPPEVPIEYPHGKYPFGEPASLPPVLCVAYFVSLAAAMNENCDASCPNLIWFQGDFAFPIDPAVLNHIRSLDWERFAMDFEM
jgi:hypothetical protein